MDSSLFQKWTFKKKNGELILNYDINILSKSKLFLKQIIYVDAASLSFKILLAHTNIFIEVFKLKNVLIISL